MPLVTWNTESYYFYEGLYPSPSEFPFKMHISRSTAYGEIDEAKIGGN